MASAYNPLVALSSGVVLAVLISSSLSSSSIIVDTSAEDEATHAGVSRVREKGP